MKADKNRLYNHVEFLTSIFPPKNYQNIESLQKAATYIFDQFSKTELSVSKQNWTAKGESYENIIASFEPEKKMRFIIGAHYDVYKNIPGADDNASSVAAILEIARMLPEKSMLPYGIDLIAFCLEEPPFFKTKSMGSYVHAHSISKENREVVGMLSLEMIGYYESLSENSPSEKNYLMVSGIKKFDTFNKNISDLLKKPGLMDSRRISYADDFLNNGPSDHRNYWIFNYPAAMVIGSGEKRGNPNYHKNSDTLETLNFDILTSAVNSIFYTAMNYSV